MVTTTDGLTLERPGTDDIPRVSLPFFEQLPSKCPCCSSGQPEVLHCSMCVLLHYEKILKDRAKEMIDEVRDDRNASAKARRAAIEEGNVPAVLEEEVVA